MRLTGRRQSSNIEVRGGGSSSSGGKTATMGIGGLIVAALITWLMGGNPLSVLQSADFGQIIMGNQDGTTSSYTPTAQEEELAVFVSQVFASTEDIWAEQFRQVGRQYKNPTMVIFKGSVKSGCGGADASVGPFYCSADQCVYLDLSFLTDMKKTLGADGDFAYAYVIAHEVGHHVQNQLGILSAAHQKMDQVSETESNQISVRIELQADYFAGAWAHNEHKTYGSLEEGDIEEGINTALVIGDDYLQKKARGYSVPESFSHGSSQQRAKWLKKGLQNGTIQGGDTFSCSYSDL